MTKWIWIVRQGIGERALIIGVGFRRYEAWEHATKVWCRRHKCNAVPREVESEWAPLRVQITV